jgi:lysophospholipid acyltransferase (LPLAT)-like uncharacterized protein
MGIPYGIPFLFMREKILGFIAYLLVRFIGMTLRYRLHFESEAGKEFFFKCHNEKRPIAEAKYLLAFFHQDELCLLNFFRNRNMAVLVSISKDGEIMNQASSWLGYHSVRGSSSKKAVAGLIASIKKVKSGYKMAFAVDGPRGPIYKVKEGICAVAKKTETQIIPVRAQASRVKYFEKSWNKAKFPLPFSRIDLKFADPKVYTSEELEKTLLGLE